MTISYVPEFIQALQEEIDALKKGKGGSVVKIFDGRLLREACGYFIYLFHLENFLMALDDTPAEIEIDGQRAPCQIVSAQGLEVQVALEKDHGQQVAEARLQTSLWFLLESLRKKFEDENNNPGGRFRLSERLFAGESDPVASHEPPRYAPSTSPPNPSQEKAIDKSFSRSLAVIWGPPGTGKTKTIAKAIEAHLNAGRRLLLVSHANTAVDEALADVAEHLSVGRFYQEGKLVRLGICHKIGLPERYPLVIPENILAKLGAALAAEKEALISERDTVSIFLASCQALFQARLDAEILAEEVDEFGQSYSGTASGLAAARAEIAVLEADQLESRERLAISLQMGKLKRLLLGQDPGRIQQEIDRRAGTIEARKRALTALMQRSHDVQDQLQQKRDELGRARAAISGHAARLGISQEQLLDAKKEKESRRDSIDDRLAEIDKELDEMQQKILNEASLIATTLTKTYTARQFPDRPFDVIIIDESSMAPLPHLYWAAGRATTCATIVGDFKQLPPICVSDGAMAKKWLGRSIFDLLQITTVAGAEQDERVALLDTQYRMAPKIAEISNRLFYDGRLKHHPGTERHVFEEPFGGRSHLVFVDTSLLNPWCGRLSTGGRFNIYSALVATTLAQKLAGHLGGDGMGIVAPYRPQCRLIGKVAQDRGLLDSLRINTVHSFQGGEEKVIIFDCVEGPGVSRWSMLDDQRPDSDARLLLNVALTRAKCKVFLIAHKNYLLASLKKESVILKIIDYFCEEGCSLSSEAIVDSYPAGDFERWANAAMGPEFRYDPHDGSLYTEKNFWPAFISDLRSAQTGLTIMSPFISLRRAGRLLEFFRALQDRKVHVRLFTRPPSEQGANMAEHAEQVIGQLHAIGAAVIQRKGMHQKVAPIDDRVAWEGSLNILSHSDTQEQMRRIEGANAVKEITRNMELDGADRAGRHEKNGSMTEPCPQCQAKGRDGTLVLRNSKFGAFWGCSRYPECGYIKNIPSRAR